MDEVERKTLTVKPDQHEAITNMKRGSDTIYTVIDRLITPPGLDTLEKQCDELGHALYDLNCIIEELTGVIKNGNDGRIREDW